MSITKTTKHPVYMHVNFLENVLPLDEVIARCADTGYDGIELRGRDVTGETESIRYLQRMYDLAVKYKIALTFGWANDASAEDAGLRQRQIEEFQAAIAFAAERGISCLNVFASPMVNPDCAYIEFDQNGSAIATDRQWDLTVDYFKQAGDHAGELGVDLCFEMHNCYIHDLAEPTADLLARIDRPSVKANIDFGNIYLNKNNKGMQEEVDTIADRIGYVHLKNVRRAHGCASGEFWCTPLKSGDINNYQFMKMILSHRYDGIVTIENTMSGDKREFMHEDLAYLKNILDDLGT